jgi:signal transduction histidine kinase
MDWIDEIFEKLKYRINNLSLKKALIVYIIISLIIISAAIAVTQSLCSNWDSLITSKYKNDNMVGTNNSDAAIEFYNYLELNKTDSVLVEIIDFIQTWSTVIYSIAGIIGLSYFYYNNKLKEPLGLLAEAADKVGNNNLDTEIYYDNRDEMGRLCHSFDSMRRQLIANNQKMWDMMEEQRRINAAFAHDLRTPLTVLRGYIDLLSRYVPEGKINEEKLLSTLTLMSEHTRRLENYSNTMKEINSLDAVPLNRISMETSNLEKKLSEITEVLNGKNGVSIKLLKGSLESRQTLLLDEAIVMEVFDNLISNALRYAKSEVEIILSLSDDAGKLMLSVADDGKGFSATDLIMATKAYYTDSSDKKTDHFGIGLYICKLLCEKHNGYITLENGMNKGAVVTAVFAVR